MAEEKCKWFSFEENPIIDSSIYCSMKGALVG